MRNPVWQSNIDLVNQLTPGVRKGPLKICAMHVALNAISNPWSQETRLKSFWADQLPLPSSNEAWGDEGDSSGLFPTLLPSQWIKRVGDEGRVSQKQGPIYRKEAQLWHLQVTSEINGGNRSRMSQAAHFVFTFPRYRVSQKPLLTAP